MISLLIVLTAMSISSIIFNSNPLNISLTLLVVSALIFVLMWISTSYSWLPTVLFLIFIGGILIIFIILSSVIPNQSMGNLKVSALITATATSFALASTPLDSVPLSGVNWYLNSNHISITLVIIMLLYFYSFIQILMSENSSIRSQTCSD